jgi:hypothetical protein
MFQMPDIVAQGGVAGTVNGEAKGMRAGFGKAGAVELQDAEAVVAGR